MNSSNPESRHALFSSIFHAQHEKQQEPLVAQPRFTPVPETVFSVRVRAVRALPNVEFSLPNLVAGAMDKSPVISSVSELPNQVRVDVDESGATPVLEVHAGDLPIRFPDLEIDSNKDDNEVIIDIPEGANVSYIEQENGNLALVLTKPRNKSISVPAA